ncbi:DUF1571 domain-containing protein [Paraburkholderia dinghuensis]|uniref:DUF1571 domain-containing protein n=1 Tax=Paraburkholderia dinghuensis TaxID=2305225 RepID=A0A3N6N953_9BURK|nr:DUF1571 domain-containing protein [Paraburkholderia dinghuensis]RQH07511.1 DUF1571 domain-containing protein [Paraburkholderia dinghuensis]
MRFRTTPPACLLTLCAALALVCASAQSLPAADADDAPATAQADQSTADVAHLPLDEQVRWLQHTAQNGALAKLDDAQLVTLFSSLDPRALPRYIAAGPHGYASCEFVMLRRERIHGRWPAAPDHMLVRIAHDPLRIYAKWLPDGAHAGQEVLYDATRRGDEMYGHPGGFFGMVSMWARLDGSFAHAQSRHRLTDLGTEFIAHRFVDENTRLEQAGLVRPAQIDVKTVDGVRVVAFTWEAPRGVNGFYASKETLGLDLRHPWFRTAQSYDSEGRLFEEVVFEQMEPKSFDALTFDSKNPDYRF